MNLISSPLAHAALTAADRTALVCGEVRYSFRELTDRCQRLISHLRRLGVRKGDRVALLALNSAPYIECYVAIPSAGFVLVPLNTRYADAEIRFALEDSGAKVLISDRDSSALTDLVDHVVHIPDSYEDALANAEPVDFDDSLAEDSVAGLFYTGGTTGRPKGVTLTHRNLTANALHWLVLSKLTAADRYLVMAPLFHVAGSLAVLASIWVGARQVILPRFDPELALDLIETEEITATLGVPTMISDVSELQIAAPRRVSTMRLIAHGGASSATQIIRRAHEAFPAAALLEVYGATETSPLLTGLADEQLLLDDPRIHSCGQPIVGVEVRIVDDQGRSLPAGEVGEIVARGPNIMSGYWCRSEETREALRGGWYHSGDLGHMAADGHLFIVDRSKDMIITGGENVYSVEVEDVLFSHPAVIEAAVFGLPDQRWGEIVCAAVVTRQLVDAVELERFCRPRLAGYKIPKRFEIRSEALPKSAAGKILKTDLRAVYAGDRGQDDAY